MTTKVGPKGQVVIPKELRRLASIEPGDEVEVDLHRPRRLAGRFARTGMAERLLDDRRAEPK